MRAHRLLAATLATIVLAATQGLPALAGGEASPEPTAPKAWLKGAFGRVVGGSPSHPATAAPDARPLDAWMRAAPLELTVSSPFEDLVGVTVVARAVDGGEPEVLSEGATSFAGPDGIGHFVVHATIELEPGGDSEHAWLIEVPDRAGGPELLWEIPGVGASLVSSGGRVSGVPGHGCFAYLCVEAGYRPPPASMAPLSIAVGETPSLHLDDGSALVHWQGRLEPLTPRAVTAREAEASFSPRPRAGPALVGLEPTAAGEWLLEVRADLDRERGWQWFLYRLTAE